MAKANRRRNRRVRAQGLASFVQSASPGFTQMPCFVEDISSGGMLLRTDRKLDPGTEVGLTLVRPGMKKPVLLSGKVVGYRPADGASVSAALRIEFGSQSRDVAVRLSELLQEFFGKEGISASLDTLVPEVPSGAPGELDQLRQTLEEAQRLLRERSARIVELERQMEGARRVIDEQDARIRLLSGRR